MNNNYVSTHTSQSNIVYRSVSFIFTFILCFNVFIFAGKGLRT